MRSEKMKAAKVKAGHYCAYQERTQQEVRDKLYQLGLHKDEVEQVLAELITENFVNEERFAKAFAQGKFKLKRWGKLKIIFELKRRKISPYCINSAIEEISNEEYITLIEQLVEHKIDEYMGGDYIIKNKTARYLINKGFEAELVWEVINNK